MFDFEMRRSLGRVLAPFRKPRPEHKAALEEKLLAKFNEIHPKEEDYRMKRFGLRKALLVAAAVMTLGVAACAAPADIEVDVGRRVSIELPEGVEPPLDHQAIEAMIQGNGSTTEARVRMAMQNGKSTFEIEVWGNGLSKTDVADEIRAKFPALAKAAIHEEVLEGRVHGTLGQKIGHHWLNLDVIDKSDVEAAKQQVMQQLAAQGVTGKVDVDVQDEGGKRKVKVRVEREDCELEEEAGMEQPAPQ